MKTFINKFKYYILALIACVCLVAGAIRLSPVNAFAATPVSTTSLISPSSKMEYYALNAPKDAYFWDGGVAIIMGNNTLHVYTGNEYERVTFGANVTIFQVKKFNDYLIVSSDATLFKIDLATLTRERLLDKDDESISGLYFDFNNGYLVTSSDNTISVYTIENGEFKFLSKDVQNTYGSTRICIDLNNDVYYTNNLATPTVYKSNVLEFGVNPTVVTTAEPNAMEVANGYLFYSTHNKLYRVSLSDFSDIDEFSPTSDYDLGKLSSPNGILFREDNGNLIITDKIIGAVQEFEIDESTATPTLKFTGFAIAKGLSAQNRLLNTVSKLEKYGDITIALDDKHLTVIENGEYKKYALTDETIGFIPTSISAGKDGCVVTDGASVKFIGYKIDSPNKNITISDNSIVDVSYQSGAFYAVALDASNKATAYKIDEETKTVTELFSEPAVVSPLIAADVFGNVYLSNDGVVYIYPFNDGYAKATSPITAFTSPTKIAVDLVGALYAISGGTVTKYDGEATEFAVTFDTVNEVDYSTKTVNAKDLAFDVNESKAYFIFEGEEVVTNCTDLSLSALDNAPTTLFEPLEYIKDYCVTTVSGNQNAFVAVDVNLYYLPLITESDTFAIKNGLDNVRLTADTELSVLSIITVENVEFYRVTVNGSEGYVPVSFTTKVLYENVNGKTYTVKKVNATKVYSNDEFELELTSLKSGTSVRVLSKIGNVAKIEYQDGGEWKTGFISASAIITPPNTAIRNVLIIIIVLTSLTGTALFFLLRKKS